MIDCLYFWFFPKASNFGTFLITTQNLEGGGEEMDAEKAANFLKVIL